MITSQIQHIYIQANFVHPVSEFKHFENKRKTQEKGKSKISLTLSLSLLSVSH